MIIPTWLQLAIGFDSVEEWNKCIPSVTLLCKCALIAISDAKKEKLPSCPRAFLTKDVSASLEFCHLYRGRQQYATRFNLLLHSKRMPIAIQHLFPGARLLLGGGYRLTKVNSVHVYPQIPKFKPSIAQRYVQMKAMSADSEGESQRLLFLNNNNAR